MITYGRNVVVPYNNLFEQFVRDLATAFRKDRGNLASALLEVTEAYEDHFKQLCDSHKEKPNAV